MQCNEKKLVIRLMLAIVGMQWLAIVTWPLEASEAD